MTMFQDRLLQKALVKFSQIPLIDVKENPTSQLIKVASSGPDTDQLKSLSICPEELSKFNIQYKPDCSYMYIVTTGAGGYWGPNLKSDYYHEKPQTVEIPEPCDPSVKTIDLGPGLKDKHYTFMNAEGLYRNHCYDTPPLGKIVWERYYEPMHRGEVIAEMPHSIWEKELERYSRGTPLMFSQGSTVKFDCCSRCGYIFTSSSPKRCDHIEKTPLKIFPDGGQAFVYNPDPNFYELSEVGSRPADKIAFCLRKVASGEVGDASQVMSSLNIPREGMTAIFVLPRTSRKKDILSEMAVLEKRLGTVPNKIDCEAVSSFCPSEGEQKQMETSLKGLEWAELLPALKNQKCILTPRLFHAIVTGDKSGTSPDVSEFEEAVRSVYQDTMSLGDAESILKDTTYSSAPFSLLRSAKASVEPVKSLLSLDPEKAALRSLSKGGPVKIIRIRKTGRDTPGPSALFLAKEYLKYQTEALAEIGEASGPYLAAACNQSTVINRS